MIEFKTRRREPFRLDLVPMINIVFLLLIFFMLTSNAIKGTHEIDLPEAQTSELNTKSNLVLLINSKGEIEHEGVVIPFNSLLTRLEEKLRERKEKVLEIQADKNIEFEFFGKVIDVARQAGAVDFVLATERPELSKHAT